MCIFHSDSCITEIFPLWTSLSLLKASDSVSSKKALSHNADSYLTEEMIAVTGDKCQKHSCPVRGKKQSNCWTKCSCDSAASENLSLLSAIL